MKIKVLFAAALFAGVVAAQTLPAGVEKRSTVAGITEYGYPNGLRVLLLADPAANNLTVNMTYLVGSRHEGYGESGMAHLLEHLNFILTSTGRDIKTELNSHGADFNGTTSFDRTNYYETFKPSDENLAWALALEADRMVNTRIEKEILDKEMTVVRNEFERGENSPARVLQERVFSTAFLWHNYGKSTIGSRADIEKVPVDKLAAFYHKYYRPDNAVLVVAGPIDATKTLAMIAKTAGAIARPAQPLDETYTAEPVQDGERSVELRRVGKGPAVILAYHGPAMAHPDSAALEVMSSVLDGPNGRLHKALIDNKLAVGAGMGNEELHDPSLIIVNATLSDDQSLAAVQKGLLEVIAGVATEPPSKEEFDRAKNTILQRMDREFADTQGLGLAMTEVAAAGDWRLLFTNFEQLKRVTVEDVVRVAKTYFKDSNRTVGKFIPEAAPDRTKVPDTPAVDAMLREFPTSINLAEGEALDPSPANIEKHLVRTQVGSLKLVLLPKASKGNQIRASLVLRFGDEKSLAGKSAAAQMAGSLLMRGTKNKTRQQIEEAMQKINARISVSGGLSSATATIETVSENLIPALQLAAELLREPSFPENDFDQIRKQILASIDRQKTEPGPLSSEILQSNLSPFPRTDVRHASTIAESIEDFSKVTLDDAKKFYAQFYGASTGELIVVGKLDQSAVQKAVGDLFGSWKSPAPYAKIQSKYLPVTKINTRVETPDKENAQFNAGLRLQMKDTDPDYPAMVLGNYMFGGAALASHLADRIRNKEGLSYSVGSGFRAASDGGDAGIFSVSAIANPKKAPEVESSFLDELKKILASGFTAEEVDRFKKALRDERIVGRSGDPEILSLLLTRNQQERTLAWDTVLDEKIDALTAEQVSAAFRRVVKADGFSIVKGGDFKAAGVYQ